MTTVEQYKVTPPPDLPPPDPMVGTVIAEKYELIRLLGQGGMGAVYEGRNASTLKRCAVKVLLSPELAQHGEAVKRFFREARASSVIESDHIVQIFDSGSDPKTGFPYMVMELLNGEDLEHVLRRHGALQPLVAAKLILQAAMGLAKAHEHQTVHRDIKPANIYLTRRESGEQVVKILDFGIAKVKMEKFSETSSGLTRDGSMLGTPLYMSPEQLRRASDIDESADVWSLGVVLFECLTGELPWGDCDGIGELVTAILTAPVPHVQDLAPWVEPNLAAVVQSALSRDPGLRLKSAAELRDALQQLVAGDARLYLEDIRPPDEQRRKSRAPRLSLPDTVMIGPTPHSGMPVVRALSHKPPRGKAGTLAVLLGAAALAITVWFVARAPMSGSPSSESPPLAEAPPATRADATPVSSTASAPLAPAVEHEPLPAERHPATDARRELPSPTEPRRPERRLGDVAHKPGATRPGSGEDASRAPKPAAAASERSRTTEPGRDDAPAVAPRLSEVFE
jgi:eukaryotic-like serine/threonine-protein kinase